MFTGLVILLGTMPIYGQVLFDDVNIDHSPDDWNIVIDTMENHNVHIYKLSDYGWYMLDSVEMLWIVGPRFLYPDSVKDKIITFCREGGKLFYSTPAYRWPSITYGDIFDDLLRWSGLEVGIRLYPRPSPHSFETYEGSPAYVLNLPPFTSDINEHLVFRGASWATEILGENAIPFCVYSNGEIAGAVYFPFKYEGDCENYIVVFTAIHAFETHVVRTVIEPTSDDWKLLINIFTAMSEGYDLGIPCDSIPFMGLPESLRYKYYRCHPLPSPFTPNGDGINDFCQFTFPDMMFSPAVIRIYDIHSVLVKDIQVPLGWAAKSAARWYGKDNSGKPVPQGVYLYEIEQNGEVICTGTVTVAR